MNQERKRRSGLVKPTFLLIRCWMGLCCLLGWAAVRAAEQPKTAPPAPVAIADSEIIPRAEQTIKSLQKIRSEVAADSTLSSIQRDFGAAVEKSDRRRESEAEALSKLRSVQSLNEIQREWSLEQSQLENWDQTLTKRSQILVAQEKDVDGIIGTWRATQIAVAKKILFKAVLEKRVEEVLREAEATRLAVQEQTTKLLKLQSQVADRLAALAKTRQEIDQAREEFSRTLFKLDSPPLWQALFHSEAPDVIKSQVAESAQGFIDDVKEFFQKYGDRVLWHGLFFLGMVAVVRFFRRGLTPETVERMGGSAATFVLNRPFASSFLLASIALPLFYPAAAGAILRIAVLPTVIPVAVLLPQLLAKTYGHWIYLLVAMYVLEFLRYVLPADWLLTRLLLLLIAAEGCIGLGLFLYSRGTELSASGSRGRLILLATRLGAFLFGVAVVSNLVGNMSLAEIVSVTLVRSAYSAALIFAGAHLLMTLIVVALQSPPLRWLRSVREYGELIALRCRNLIRLAAIIFWAALTVYILGISGDVLSAAEGFLQLRWQVGAAEISVQALAAFFAVFLIAVLVSRMVRFVLTEEIFPRIRLPRGAPGAVDVLSRYGVLLLGFFIALAAAGVDLSKVTLLISALGVGIGFGLQGVVNNFVSGLILVFEHPVQVGDFVEVGTTFGEVREIGFRASVLRTPDGADVIIPNSELVGARFVNWSLSDWLRRISISVNVAYGTDPNRVIEILIGVARKHPAVLADPAPTAVFDRFGDSALGFTLLCWSFVDRVFPTRSELTIAINDAFNDAGIQIPFPQQDLHVHWADRQGAAAESAEAALLLSGKRSLAKK